MKLPEVKINPTNAGCWIYMQKAAAVPIENRLMFMGYVLEHVERAHLPVDFEGVFVRGLTADQIRKLLELEARWTIVTLPREDHQP